MTPPQRILPDRSAVHLVGLLSLAVVLLALMWIAHDIFLLMLMGAVFAVFLDAGARVLRRWVDMPRRGALAIVVVILVLVNVGLAYWLYPSLAADASRLSDRLPKVLQSLETGLRQSDEGRAMLAEAAQLVRRLGFSEDFVRRFLGVFATFAGGLVGTLVIIVIGLYLAFEPSVYANGLVSMLPASRRERGRLVLAELGNALRWWLAGRLASMTVVFAATWLGLTLLGIPLAFLLAVIAGLLSFVPNIGPILSAVPAVVLAMGQGIHNAMYVVLLYSGIQMIESYSITPLIQRRAAAIAPALLLSFQLVMGVLAGFLGLFAATPLLVLLIVLVKTLYLHDRLGDSISLPGGHRE